MLRNALSDLEAVAAFLRSALLWLMNGVNMVCEWLWLHPLATLGILCVCWAGISWVNASAKRETDELMARMERGEKITFWDLW